MRQHTIQCFQSLLGLLCAFRCKGFPLFALPHVVPLLHFRSGLLFDNVLVITPNDLILAKPIMPDCHFVPCSSGSIISLHLPTLAHGILPL